MSEKKLNLPVLTKLKWGKPLSSHYKNLFGNKNKTIYKKIDDIYEVKTMLRTELNKLRREARKEAIAEGRAEGIKEGKKKANKKAKKKPKSLLL